MLTDGRKDRRTYRQKIGSLYCTMPEACATVMDLISRVDTRVVANTDRPTDRKSDPYFVPCLMQVRQKSDCASLQKVGYHDAVLWQLTRSGVMWCDACDVSRPCSPKSQTTK